MNAFNEVLSAYGMRARFEPVPVGVPVSVPERLAEIEKSLGIPDPEVKDAEPLAVAEGADEGADHA